MGVSQQTVTRCLQRAAELGVLAALDDRARTGREARITAEARTWLTASDTANGTGCLQSAKAGADPWRGVSDPCSGGTSVPVVDA